MFVTVFVLFHLEPLNFIKIICKRSSKMQCNILGCIKHVTVLGLCPTNTEILVNAIKKFVSEKRNMHGAFTFVYVIIKYILDRRKL